MGRSVRHAFTLIELLVVAAIIAAMVAVVMPAIKSILTSNQRGQAENTLRASLLAARAYAMTNLAIAGVRFDPNGQIVMIRANNQSTYMTVDNFRSPTRPRYQMVAVSGRAPESLSGPYRVTSGTYKTSGDLDICTANWWCNEQWFLTCVMLFSPSGHGIQAQCIFPNGWYPSTAGTFGRWTYNTAANTGTAYQFAGGGGLDWMGNANPVCGPDVTTHIRMYDYSAIRGTMGSAAVSPHPTIANRWYLNGSIAAIKSLIDSTATDFVLDVNTGIVMRASAEMRADY